MSRLQGSALASNPCSSAASRCYSSLCIRASIETPSNKKKGFGAKPSSSPPNKTPKHNPTRPQETPPHKKKAILLHEDSRELRSVLKSVEKDPSKRRSQKLNIDPDVAAQGNVDFVKVESWGDEGTGQSELGKLKVKSFTSSSSSNDVNAPFYERLVHRLQLLESKGHISVVQARSLPHFNDWAFGEERYLQYLVDQHAVFEALRSGITNIYDPSREEVGCQEAGLAVRIFHGSLGLDRCEAAQTDIKAILNATSAPSNCDTEVPKPTTQTAAYVKYLKQLTGDANHNLAGKKQACLRLLAHIFAVYVSHLSTGSRIGAKALDCVPLVKQVKAVSLYRDYPQHVRDPLKIFIAAINKVTDYVTETEDQEMVMEELPKAIQKTSLLLVLLAVTEHREI